MGSKSWAVEGGRRRYRAVRGDGAPRKSAPTASPAVRPTALTNSLRFTTWESLPSPARARAALRERRRSRVAENQVLEVADRLARLELPQQEPRPLELRGRRGGARPPHPPRPPRV